MIDSSGSSAAAGPPQSEDQQLLVFLKDLNLKISQLIQAGQHHEVQSVLTAANLNSDTLIAIM